MPKTTSRQDPEQRLLTSLLHNEGIQVSHCVTHEESEKYGLAEGLYVFGRVQGGRVRHTGNSKPPESVNRNRHRRIMGLE